MCCRSEWQERMYIYKWHEVDQTKHEIFCVHIVCNEIQVKVNLEITTFFFYLRFPYCPNFFWFGVVELLNANPYFLQPFIEVRTEDVVTIAIVWQIFTGEIQISEGIHTTGNFAQGQNISPCRFHKRLKFATLTNKNLWFKCALYIERFLFSSFFYLQNFAIWEPHLSRCQISTENVS